MKVRTPASRRGEGTREQVRPTGFVAGLDRIFRTALIIIPIGVIGNVAFSLLVTDRELLTMVAGFPRGYLAIALLLGIIPWFTNALRLLIWTRFLGHGVGFRDAFRITLATDLGAAVSPTAVGGGFFKWGLLVQRGVSPGAAASITTLTPIEDGIFFAIALPVALILTASWGHPVFSSVAARLSDSALPVLGGALIIAVVVWLLARWVLRGGVGVRRQRRSYRIVHRLRRRAFATWVDARQVYRLVRTDGKLRFALSLSLTAVQWTARYSIISALVAFLGAPVQPVLFWMLQWVVFTLAAFIPTPGAAGGAEAAFFVVYSPFIPSSLMPLATAGWRFFTFYILLALAGVLYIVLGGLRRGRR